MAPRYSMFTGNGELFVIVIAGLLGFFLSLTAGIIVWLFGDVLDALSTYRFLKRGEEESNIILKKLLKRLKFPYAVTVFIIAIELPVGVLFWYLFHSCSAFAMVGVAHMLAALYNLGYS